MKRASGILLPIFSLPSNYGIGTFGRSAYDFIDFLVETGQSYWQILPLTPTSYGDSPYQSFSAQAGNPYFIDFDQLAFEGYLNLEDYQSYSCDPSNDSIDYHMLYQTRPQILKIAVNNFLKKPDSDYDLFIEKSEWLEDYSLFMALKEAFQGQSWQNWPEAIRVRQPNTLNEYRKKLTANINYHKVCQYFFFKQWQQVKNYANKKHIQIIGDIPLYVAEDSVDVWTTPQLFQLNDQKKLQYIAGTPPDYFSELGQIWGNPVYNWNYHQKTGYQWWFDRLRFSLELYDYLRIDHFRGFEAYWRITYQGTESDARLGQWVKGPGWDFFNHLKKELGPCPIIAENLGVQSAQLQRLIQKTNFPIMYVLQFAFSGQADNDHLPHAYQANSVAYVGTHDNETALGWAQNPTNYFHSLQASSYLNKGPDESISWAMNRGIAASPSKLAIYSMADLLELSNEARINTPSTLGNNWRWRITDARVYESIKKPLIDLTATYFRYNEKNNP